MKCIKRETGIFWYGRIFISIVTKRPPLDPNLRWFDTRKPSYPIPLRKYFDIILRPPSLHYATKVIFPLQDFRPIALIHFSFSHACNIFRKCNVPWFDHHNNILLKYEAPHYTLSFIRLFHAQLKIISSVFCSQISWVYVYFVCMYVWMYIYICVCVCVHARVTLRYIGRLIFSEYLSSSFVSFIASLYHIVICLWLHD
jgi:hypothetical protein